MELDVREFLQRFTLGELVGRRILVGPDQRLDGKSVKPLIELMREQGISLLTASERGWRLDVTGTWQNASSKSRNHSIECDLEHVRGIFNNQNNYINPHFRSESGLD